MSLSLVLNSSNVSNTNTKSEFTYSFIQGALEVPPNSLMTISNITIPYSFFNVTSQYANQRFNVIMPTSAGFTTLQITIPAGFYSVDDINNYLLTQFIANNFYLLDSAGNYVVYVSLSYNTTYYAVQLNCFAVPTSLPAGYTNPAAMTFPASATTPQFFIPSTSTLNVLLGLNNNQNYPTVVQATNFSQLSTTTPVGSNINNIIVRCNLIDNNCSMPSDVLGSFPINSSFGSNINYEPAFEIKLKVKSGRYDKMVINFTDQNFNTINSLDSNVLITLLLTLGKKE